MKHKPERPNAGSGRFGGVLLLWALVVVAWPFSSFTLWPAAQGRRAETASRRAVQAATKEDVLLSAGQEGTINYTEKLLEKLPVLLGRRNVTLDFKVLSTDLGTEVRLSLPNLAYWQYVQGKGRIRRERPLPQFEAAAETLSRAKEAAAQQAMKALFREIRTSANTGNNQPLAKLIASMFAESVQVADIRYQGEQHASQKSPGNVLYALAYLSREPDAYDETKRIMAVSSVSKISSYPWVHQVLVQDRQRLILPRNVSVFRVAVKTPPADLKTQMEKELRASGAVSLQLKGTMAAQQALLALSALEYAHRFVCYFARVDEGSTNATELLVQVSRKWRPIS